MPASGGGGCHTAQLSIANYGRLAGISAEQVVSDIAAHVHGSRRVTAGEITKTVNKAFNSQSTFTPHVAMRTATPAPKVDGAKLLAGIVERGADFTEAELWESSPVRIDWPPEHDASEVLRRLYQLTDRLFIGTRYDAGVEHVLTVADWLKRFETSAAIPEHIIPNPLTGRLGKTKEGKDSYRADDCVAQFRFAVVEFDEMPRDQQIRFWAGVKLPVVALLDSGGKSVHGWVRIDAADAADWQQRVEGKLFDMLTAIGADKACKNEARLSRMPGHYRAEKSRWQRVLYLNPTGGQVIP
ncbi:MAG: hypothetical protein PCFJNLEI_03643 [Verrucomicrobiae bacterium]|nr:hypothetical protein [Verrucomicrobiae bacterium]